MPKGGKRPGAGRKRGVPNKVNRELGAAAREYTDEALRALVRVMRKKSAPDNAVIAAANAIINRGHGLPAQAIKHSGFVGDLSKLTDDEIAFLERIGERLAAAGEDAGGAATTGAPAGQGVH